MTLLFKKDRGGGRSVEIDSVVRDVVESASFYDDGKLERLARQIDALTSLCGHLALSLPDAEQRKLVESIAFSWSEAE